MPVHKSPQESGVCTDSHHTYLGQEAKAPLQFCALSRS